MIAPKQNGDRSDSVEKMNEINSSLKEELLSLISTMEKQLLKVQERRT